MAAQQASAPGTCRQIGKSLIRRLADVRELRRGATAREAPYKVEKLLRSSRRVGPWQPRAQRWIFCQPGISESRRSLLVLTDRRVGASLVKSPASIYDKHDKKKRKAKAAGSCARAPGSQPPHPQYHCCAYGESSQVLVIPGHT